MLRLWIRLGNCNLVLPLCFLHVLPGMDELSSIYRKVNLNSENFSQFIDFYLKDAFSHAVHVDMFCGIRVICLIGK